MAAGSNQLISFYFSSLNLRHLLEHKILIDGLLQALCWLDCSSLLPATYVLLGAALHVCRAGFKLNLHSSCYYPRNEMKTKYIKTIAKVNSKFMLLLTK